METFLFIIISIFTKKIALYGLFIFFILIHELSHMVTGVLLGFKPKKFYIMPFGFKIQFKELWTNKNIEIRKIAIAMAGPLINLLIMIFAISLHLHKNIVYSNLIIALFNLIPIYPLDGGRILKSILNIKLENIQSYKIINKISNISIIILTGLSSIIILYIKNISLVFVLAYLWYVVIRENKKYRIIKRIYNVIENK